MITPELQTYIRQQLGAGITKDVIRQNLLAQGWNSQDLDEGFLSIENPQFSQEATPSVASGGHKMVWAIVIVLFLLIGVGGAYAAYHYGLFNKLFTPTVAQLPVADTTENSAPITNTESATTTPQVEPTTTCDNYQCLIAAASKCDSISVTISYADIPFPFSPDMTMSGQTEYEIKKFSGVNDCILVYQTLSNVLSISEKGRKDTLARGMTNSEIDTRLRSINNGFKVQAETESKYTCQSNINTISTYLADHEKDLKEGNFKLNATYVLHEDAINVEYIMPETTTTYTTSSGQKLVCKLTLPPGQKANTSTIITDTECITKNGIRKYILDDGTACSQKETDLGSVIDGSSMKLSDQCCVLK